MPRATAPDARRYMARQPFDYVGLALDQGQIVELVGAKNDAALIRLGYVIELESRTTTYECAECGAAFTSIEARSAHGRKRHPDRDLTPDQEDEREEREERMLADVAPLYLDKTKAAMGAA